MALERMQAVLHPNSRPPDFDAKEFAAHPMRMVFCELAQSASGIAWRLQELEEVCDWVYRDPNDPDPSARNIPGTGFTLVDPAWDRAD